MNLSHSQGCHLCGSKNNLFRCSACHVTPYCSREHQVAGRPGHKRACNAVKKAQTTRYREEQTLRARPGDAFLPANVFENGAGHFWGFTDTRPYMRARFALVEALLKINAFTAVEAALDNLMDMLRLCRGDNMGVRDLVPALFLRLARDQECYDFVKWWQTTAQDSDYDWGNTDLPYLDVRNADVFEPVEIYCNRFSNLNHTVSVMLLKIRLFLDIRALQNSSVLDKRLPQELLDNVRGQLVSTIVAHNKDIMESKDQKDCIKRLEEQVNLLYTSVKKINKYFWPGLLQPEAHLAVLPDAYSPGNEAHMQLALRYCYAAWAETPGAIDMIRDLTRNDTA